MAEINPKLAGLILCVLVVQTTLTVILLRYSLTLHSAQPYLGSALVLANECLKYVMAIVLLLFQQGLSVHRSLRVFVDEVVRKPRETLLLSVPAMLYTVQNNLLIVALKNLDAATFQVTYQLKILTTAVFSVILLNRKLNSRQWISLVLLTGGVALVQMPAANQQNNDDADSEKLNETQDSIFSDSNTSAGRFVQDHWIGLVAVLISCFSSGFAGVFYEKQLKSSAQPSIVLRNLQLGVFSVLLAGLTVIQQDFRFVQEKGLFHGFTPLVWTIVVVQAVGGLVVAATIKYADNILKGFATSISIILSSIMSWLVLGDLQPAGYFVPGTCIVLISTVLYSFPVQKEMHGGKDKILG
eukprot:TRINITY_DN28126_c0_g1_i1.p1 TRINITY_DN28126_c0_g1~~TRINITY_DN28126_c0_g1_i1.p1  ORF type:complete len:355 (+),score=37.81 TRINITY_DN28126_c0_g1_i1:127-1191(+)